MNAKRNRPDSLADGLAAAAERGEHHYAATALAGDVTPTVRRIGRRRVARQTVGITGAAIVLAGLVAGVALAVPAAMPAPGASPTPEPAISTAVPDIVDAAPSATKCEHFDFGAANAYTTGEFPDSALCTLWDGTSRVEGVAGFLLYVVNDEYREQFGEDLCIVSSYRALGDPDAAPRSDGASELPTASHAHGRGAAIDLCEGQDSGESFDWLSAHALQFGWHNPQWDQDEINEPWHWEFLPMDFAFGAQITIPERATFPHVFRAMTATFGIGGAPPIGTVESSTLADLNRDYGGAFGSSLEGWVEPGTYDVKWDLSPDSWLPEAAIARYESLTEIGVAPKDMARILTLASLVEAESPRDDTKAIVAGVIQNRLDAGMPLELESPLRYLRIVLGTGRDPDVTPADERESDSPYNTYKFTGLPPGAINSPSRGSILSALNPAQHDYLYFVTVNPVTGETRFAETYPEHLANVDLLNEWIAANEG